MDLGSAVLTLTIDESGLVSGIAKAKDATGDLEKSTKQDTESMADSWKGMLQAAEFAAVVAAIKKIVDIATEMLNAFAEDERATISMTAALMTNVNATDKTALSMHNWAEEMQRTTIFTHDQIEAQVGMLSGLNLTEAEMKRLLSAAMTLASTGYVSLEMAVKGLTNAQENGTVGMLGRAVPAIRTLTKEQLLHGDAIDWIEKHYPTMTAAIADSTYGLQQRMSHLIDEQKAKIGEVVAQAYAGAQQLSGSIDTAGTVAAKVVDIFIKSSETLAAWMKFQYDFFVGFMKLTVDLIMDVGKIMWAPVEYFFHGTILTIKNAFIDGLNFILAQVTDFAHTVGKVLSDATGGVAGKGLLGIDLGQIQKIKDEGIVPLGTAITKIFNDGVTESKKFFTSTGMDLAHLGDAWKAHGKTIEDTIKKVQNNVVLPFFQSEIDASAKTTKAEEADAVAWLAEHTKTTNAIFKNIKDIEDATQKQIDAEEKARQGAFDAQVKRMDQELMAFKTYFNILGQAIATGTLSWKTFGEMGLHAMGHIISSIGDQLAALSAADIVKAYAALASILGAWAAPGFFAAATIEGLGAAAAWTAGAALESIKLEQGGSFTVPPGYEDDSFGMRVSSGEHVDVTPAGESGGGMQSVVVNLDGSVLASWLGKATKNQQVIIHAGAIVP